MNHSSERERVELTVLPTLVHSSSLPNLPSTSGALQPTSPTSTTSTPRGTLPVARGTTLSRSSSLTSGVDKLLADRSVVSERVSYPLPHSGSQRYSSNYMLKAPVSVSDSGTFLVGGRLEAVQVPGPIRPKTPPSAEKSMASKLEDLQKKLQNGGSSGMFARDESVPVFVDMPPKQKTDLVDAVKADDVNTLYKLFDVQRLSIRIVATDGNTVFHIAAQHGALKALKVCLRQNKDDIMAIINIQNSKGTCAVHLAALFGHTEILTRLVEAGAYVDQLDCCGCTPLHVAAHEHLTDLYTHIVRLGGSASTEDDEGNTPAEWLTAPVDPTAKTGKAWYEHMLFIRQVSKNYAPKKKLGGLTMIDPVNKELDLDGVPELPPRFNEVHLAWKQFLMSTVDTTGAASLLPLAARVRVQGHLLTPYQIQAARKEFEAVDKDSSGWIDRLELSHWLEHLLQWDAPNKVLFQASVNALFMAVDVDHSGLIDFQEFLLLYVSIVIDPGLGQFRLAAAPDPSSECSPQADGQAAQDPDIKHIGWKEHGQNTFAKISNVIVAKPVM
eukprot:TRINITY_DN2489_c0_g1_i1.p1 TRINITY_DN2489_c0_g1~~TRINITY_DN2489_c0_g1_i1.p1  ORF type:complete len:644 (+),score=198.91 TRINITY_DN2489_c0_g1_i1:269-1933(+)